MLIYRIFLIGVVGLLGACATPSVKLDTKPAVVQEKPALVQAKPALVQATPRAIAMASPAASSAGKLVDPSTALAPARPQVVAPIASTPPAPSEVRQAPAPMPPRASKAVATEPVPSVKPRRVVREPLPANKAVATVTAPVVASARVSGHVTLSAAKGQSIAAGDVANTLVYFVPKTGAANVKPGRYTIYTHDHDFQPEAMAVPVGSTVTFVNLDDVRHNVFSATPAQPFDLGYQAAGEKVSHVFGHSGAVQVNCRVHRSMQLSLLVVPSAYRSAVAANGSFNLDGLPAGPGTLYFWNPRAALVRQAVTLPVNGDLKQSLQVTLPSVTTELNAQVSP